jgi:hypothetical protein|tara:strand:+ start:723 stop:971 length:249 start_codon:yes stop_codon:yes gene_type:complete
MSYYTEEEKRERVKKYLTSDELGEYDYIIKDLNHWKSEYEKLENLIENAESQRNRYEYLSDVYKDISEHDNTNYEYQSVEDE